MEEGMLAAPHPMVDGTTDTEYYKGDVLKATEEQRSWVRANRPDDETLPENLPVPEGHVPRPDAHPGGASAPAGAMGHTQQSQQGAGTFG